MRQMIILVTISISLATAAASKGDFASHVGSVVSDCGTKATGIQSRSEISQVGPDFVRIQNQMREGGGSVSTTETIIQMSDFIDGRSLRNFYSLKSYCSQFKNAIMEQISVSAGTFWTCRMSNLANDVLEEVWFGGVALGAVKFKSSHTEFNDPACIRTVTWELEKFYFNDK